MACRAHARGAGNLTIMEGKQKSILVIAEHDNSSLKAATLNTVTAARKLGEDVHALVVGNGADAAANAMAAIPGVARVLRIVSARMVGSSRGISRPACPGP